jgi:uncharacterized OsmC-like protein
MTRPEVNDARRFPPSLKPEIRPNKHAATSGATASRLNRAHRSRARAWVPEEGRAPPGAQGSAGRAHGAQGRKNVRMPYTVDLRTVQAPLKEKYRSDPTSALVVTEAHSIPSDLADSRHCTVAPAEFPEVTIRAGLHPGAGGAGDTPCSGDILASALAICEESTLRSVAANMGIELESVHVDVRIHWDFRGTMGVDRDVPVGATSIEMRTQVKVKDGVDPERAKRLLSSAERYCSTLQTLRNGVAVATDFSLA